MTVIIDHNDIGKSKEEVLMDLIYETNLTRIPLSKIKFGDPRDADTRPDLKTDHNTFIPVSVSADYSTLYQASSGLMYRRRGADEHLENVQDVVFEFHTTDFPIALCDILPQINAQLEYPLDCSDILSYQIEGPGEQDIVIKMNPKSYLWNGQSKVKANIINDNLVPLYVNVALRGFDVYGQGEYTGLPN